MKRILPTVVVSTVLLSSCGLLPLTQASESASVTAEGDNNGVIVSAIPEDPLASFVYDQTVDWKPCGELECATVVVPLDWSVPDGDTITLAVNRHKATDQGNRIGSLLLNPGGPGGSGIDLLESFATSAGERVLASYDLIGFDPRGVGESSPIDCGEGPALDAMYLRDFTIEDAQDLDAATQANADFSAQCRGLTGPLIGNVDTVSVARDMDVIRAVLGDEKLYYLGFSYGTQLGATYAQIYPDHVGRMVLDGAVDFLLPGEEQGIQQAAGFENALTNFITWCLDRTDTCPLDGPVENARQQIAALPFQAMESPYASGGLTPVNGNLLMYGIAVTLYDEASWEYLEVALDETINSGTASVFSQLAGFYLDRDDVTGTYASNSTPVFTAIGCLDAEPGEWTIEDQVDLEARLIEASPTFGWWFAGSSCEGWPYSADERVTSLDDAATAAPMLVIGTTNDPATTYSWAQSLSGYLGATLLTYDGEGHTAYGRSNQCIIDAVDGYLVDGVLPAEGTVC